MKWLVDYQMLRGVSMFTFGYYAMSYARQWTTLFEPQSGPISPYWDFETPYFRYIHRVSSVLAEGDPATDDRTAGAADRMDAAEVRRLYDALRPSLKREADRDRAEEAGRTILNPDGTPII